MNPKTKKLWQRMKAFGQTCFQEAERVAKLKEQDALILSYFIKADNTTYSTFILLDMKFIQDARILTKFLFENMVYLTASTKEKDFVDKFKGEFKIQKEKLLSRLSEYDKITKQSIVNIGEVKKQEIQSQSKAAKDKGLGIPQDMLRKLSKKYKFEKDYLVTYKGLHDETHSLPPSVRKYSTTKGFAHYPDLDLLEITAVTAFWCYLHSLEAIVKYFKLTTLKQPLQELKSEFSKEVGRVKSKGS